MTKIQFLLLFTIFIPMLNCALTYFSANPCKSFSSKALPILFFASLIGLDSSFERAGSETHLTFIKLFGDVSFAFAFDKISLLFSFLLGLLWLVLTFYFQRFFDFYQSKNLNSFWRFLSAIVAIIVLIIFSKNLLGIFFFYLALVIVSHFFALRFIYKQESRLSKFFTFLLYVESSLFFLAIVATYKFAGQLDFADGGFIAKIASDKIKIGLFVLYLTALFLTILLPFYLLYSKVTPDLINSYILFFLSYALSSLYVLTKLIYSVFGFSELSQIISQINFHSFELLFFITLLAPTLAISFSKELKSSFFYLLLEKFLLTLFIIIAFIAFDQNRLYLPLVSFCLSISLIFICLANLRLYFSEASDKDSGNLFRNLRVTVILLVFAVLNLVGIVPAIGAIERFFVVKLILQKHLIVSGLILLLDFVSIAAFSLKVIYPLFLNLGQEEAKKESKKNPDLELARTIDFDSALILTGLTLGILMFVLVMFFPLLNQFVS